MSTLSYEPVTSSPARLDWRRWIDVFSSLIGLGFVFILFTILSNTVTGARPFATWANMELILRLTAVVGIAALGMTIIIISGGIDLSVGAVIALTTVVIAQLLLRGYSASVAAAAGIGAAAVCGLMVGGIVTGLKLPPFVVSLGLWSALRGSAEQIADNVIVYPPMSGPNDWRKSWLSGLLQSPSSGRGGLLHVLPPGVWLLLALAVAVTLVLRYTRFGRHVFAIGSNEQAARLCGVPVNKTKLLVYALGGAFAGVAGVLEFSFITMGDPTTRNGAELDVIAAVVIGGASLSGGHGSIFGTIVGAIVMTMVGNGCTKLGWDNSVQKIATGGIIIFAVALDRLRHPRN